MATDLKKGLANRLKQVGAYDVGIADPRVGFEHVLPGKHPDSIWKPLPVERIRKHPLDLWKECRSVVVIAVACPPETNNTYLGPYAPWKGNRNIGPVPEDIQSDEFAMDRLSRILTASIRLQGMTLLENRGYKVSFQMPPLKLSAYEAGLGVYGRSGLIIHPVIGNRFRLGAIMTDAVLEPDGRLEGFDPCKDCDLCIKMCPAKAHDPTKSYPYSFDRVKCIRKRAEIAKEGLYCHNCYAVCPVGKLDNEKLLSIQEAKSFYKPHRT